MAVTQYKNLVFEGGGTKGSAYAGCMDVLEQAGLYAQVERVAGTSAGSITACLLACGAMPAGLKESVYNTDFNVFVQDPGGFLGDAYRIFFKYGMHSGDPLVKILKKNIKQYSGKADLTFEELVHKSQHDPKTFKQLYVVASDLHQQRAKIFCYEHTPKLPVWKAVRASVSLPFIFEPFNINHEYFVDGGLSWVYPIDIFDSPIQAFRPQKDQCEPVFNPNTLGFYLESKKQFASGASFAADKIKVSSLKIFGESLATFLLQTANAEHIHPDDLSRTVFINDLGVSGTTFNTPKAVIDQLVQSGKKATELFLNKHSDEDDSAASKASA